MPRYVDPAMAPQVQVIGTAIGVPSRRSSALQDRRVMTNETTRQVRCLRSNRRIKGAAMPVLIFLGTVGTVAVRRYPRPVVELPTGQATHSVAPYAQERAELGNCRLRLIRQYEVHKLPVFFKHGLWIR